MTNFGLAIRGIICFFQFHIYKKIAIQGKQSRYLYLNVRKEHVHRYVMCTNELLNRTEAQITVVLPFNLLLLGKLHLGRNWKPWESYILLSNHIKFQFRSPYHNWKTISTDYYNDGRFNHDRHYRIPIGPAPFFYSEPRIPELTVTKRRAGFFAGDTSSEYEKFDESLWQQPSRNSIYSYLEEHYPEVLVPDRMDRESFYSQLAQATYFLALPGYIMPLCHNLYEATYFGCCPILHSSTIKYIDNVLGDILLPFAWTNLSELPPLLRSLDNGGLDKELTTARLALRQYWNHELDSNFIFDSINQSEIAFLCAEELSIPNQEPQAANS